MFGCFSQCLFSDVFWQLSSSSSSVHMPAKGMLHLFSSTTFPLLPTSVTWTCGMSDLNTHKIKSAMYRPVIISFPLPRHAAVWWYHNKQTPRKIKQPNKFSDKPNFFFFKYVLNLFCSRQEMVNYCSEQIKKKNKLQANIHC